MYHVYMTCIDVNTHVSCVHDLYRRQYTCVTYFWQCHLWHWQMPRCTCLIQILTLCWCRCIAFFLAVLNSSENQTDSVLCVIQSWYIFGQVWLCRLLTCMWSNDCGQVHLCFLLLMTLINEQSKYVYQYRLGRRSRRRLRFVYQWLIIACVLAAWSVVSVTMYTTAVQIVLYRN